MYIYTCKLCICMWIYIQKDKNMYIQICIDIYIHMD